MSGSSGGSIKMEWEWQQRRHSVGFILRRSVHLVTHCSMFLFVPGCEGFVEVLAEDMQPEGGDVPGRGGGDPGCD